MLPSKIQPSQLTTDLRAASTADLKEQLAKVVSITAEYLTYIAAVWQELESRGEDMSSVRHGLMAYIPLIATRQLDARAVVNYAGQKTLLSSIAALPLSQQQKLIDRGQVEIVELSEDKQQIVKSVALDQMTAAQVHLSFGDGQIKTPEQQYQILLVRDGAKSRAKPKREYRMTSNLKIDGDNLVIAGKPGVKIDDRINLLAECGQLAQHPLRAKGRGEENN